MVPVYTMEGEFQKPVPVPTYWLTRFMILRLLGIIYAIAFLVAAAAAAAAYLLLDRWLPGVGGLLRNVQDVGPFRLPVNTVLSGLLLLPVIHPETFEGLNAKR